MIPVTWPSSPKKCAGALKTDERGKKEGEVSTPLKRVMCELRDYLFASSCASAVFAAVDWYTHFGEETLNNARTVWRGATGGRLPDDLVALLEQWIFPEFEPLETKHLPLKDAQITAIVAEWHRKLFDTLDSFCRAEIPRKVLCGFNVVDDLIFYLTSDRDFQGLWAALGKPSPGMPQREPQSPSDALASLIKNINTPSKAGKFYPDSATLDQIYNAAAQAGLHSERFLGGAAGNMAYVLSQMGMEVHIHCPYHSDQLRWDELAPTARYVEFNRNQYQLISASPGQPNLPHKTTVGFDTVPDWSFPQLNTQATQPGRALFIGRHPTLNPQYRNWNDVQVGWQGQNHPWNGPWVNDPAVWTHPTVFGNYEVTGQTLNVVPAEAQVIRQLVANERYDVALLKDVGDQLGQAQLEQARKTQLDEFRQARVPIHVEISPKHNPAFLRYLISSSPHGNASYWSAGLNPDELLDITDRDAKVWDYRGQILDPYLFPESRTSEDLLQRFVRALHLLDKLKLDWIYVHGNELDIAVWRKPACDLIEQLGSNTGVKLRDGMLLAKATVVAAMIIRNPAPQLRQLINNRLAQGSALAVKGFWALFSFARQFSKWAASRYRHLNVQEQGVYQDLLKNGFYEAGAEFGVAVAPVFWPDEAQYLNATGAGDYSSAVVAAYVWGK